MKREKLPFTAWELVLIETAIRQWSRHAGAPLVAADQAYRLAKRIADADVMFP